MRSHRASRHRLSSFGRNDFLSAAALSISMKACSIVVRLFCWYPDFFSLASLRLRSASCKKAFSILFFVDAWCCVTCARVSRMHLWILTLNNLSARIKTSCLRLQLKLQVRAMFDEAGAGQAVAVSLFSALIAFSQCFLKVRVSGVSP